MELGSGGGLVVEGNDVLGADGAAFITVEEVEGGLAGVMGQEEVVGGGHVAPGKADGAAAEEVLGGQANEDLPDDDLLREATKGCCHCGLRHGHR